MRESLGTAHYQTEIRRQRVIIDSLRAELERHHRELEQWQRVGKYATELLRILAFDYEEPLHITARNLKEALAATGYKAEKEPCDAAR